MTGGIPMCSPSLLIPVTVSNLMAQFDSRCPRSPWTCILSVSFRCLSVSNSTQKRNSMHPHFEKADRLSRETIGAAIEVHRILGPGLLESIYEKCLLREFELRAIPVVTQEYVQIAYKGAVFTEQLKFDLLIDGVLLLELKAVQKVLPVHQAQLLSYMKLLDVPLGLLLNFHEMKLVDGVSRIILSLPNEP